MIKFIQHRLLAVFLSSSLVLTACGGGNDPIGIASSNGLSNTNSSSFPGFLPTSNTPPSAQMVAIQKEGARLNSEELAQIAATGVLPVPFNGTLLSGTQDSSKPIEQSTSSVALSPQIRINATLGASPTAPSLAPAYRFYNNQTLGHFYTTNTGERDNIIANFASTLSYEGAAFFTSSTSATGLSPVHRFYNTQNGVHFFTISEAERTNVAANLPNFKYEGIAYYASTVAGTGLTPLYRFYYASKGFHFFTNSIAERDNIIATLPSYTYEGIGYYVLSSDLKAPAPSQIPEVTRGSVYIQDFPFGPFNLVNLSTGAITRQTSVSCGGISSATIGPDGAAIGSLSDGRVVKFDPVSGRCETLFTAPEWLSSIAYSPSGNLVAQSQATFFGAKQIYTFSLSGVQISKVPLSGASSISGLAFGADGDGYGPGFIGWFSLSPITGIAKQIATASNISGSKICVDQAGVAYGEAFGILYRYNLKTGALIGQLTLQRDIGGAIVCR